MRFGGVMMAPRDTVAELFRHGDDTVARLNRHVAARRTQYAAPASTECLAVPSQLITAAPAERRLCKRCGQKRSQEHFSGKQWKKGGCCTPCVNQTISIREAKSAAKPPPQQLAVVAGAERTGFELCREGSLDDIQRAAAGGWDVADGRDKHGSTGLMWAAGAGHVGVCKWLLEMGAKVNAQNKDGRTALMWAARNGQRGAVDWLLNQVCALTVEVW